MIRKCRETFIIALYFKANFYLVEKKTFKIPQITIETVNKHLSALYEQAHMHFQKAIFEPLNVSVSRYIKFAAYGNFYSDLNRK
jgi:hypothetical protein